MFQLKDSLTPQEASRQWSVPPDQHPPEKVVLAGFQSVP